MGRLRPDGWGMPVLCAMPNRPNRRRTLAGTRHPAPRAVLAAAAISRRNPLGRPKPATQTGRAAQAGHTPPLYTTTGSVHKGGTQVAAHRRHTGIRTAFPRNPVSDV